MEQTPQTMKMKQTIAALALLLAAEGQAQTQISTYQPGVTVEGVTYFLPQTALRVTVKAEKTVTHPGRLHKYAFRYLRLDNVPTEETTQWTLKGITVDPYGVADKTKAYSIKLKNKTVAPLVSLTHDGVLLSINAEQEETQLSAKPTDVPAANHISPARYMSQDILAAGSTAKQAELCAQEIYDLRESRKDLVSGQADNTPKDGQQLQLMLNQLDEQANALESLFAGYTETSTHYFTFDVLPTQTDSRQVLFRFSTVEGPVEADDVMGQPVYLSLKNLDALPVPIQDEDSNKKKQKMQQGVWYNVPARQHLTVSDLNQTYAEMDVPMGQFGYTEVLANILFDKKTTTKAYFHQENGGLKKLEQ